MFLKINSKLLKKFYWKFSNITANFSQNLNIFYCFPITPPTVESMTTALLNNDI